ncbi:MAG: hypothetical protein HC923_03645 [Myxococcales bacterium]|nr:hypothetical protein [Myxococcales bacterium]
MKCPCCGTTTGPWWLDRIDGVLCVSCAGWVSGFYALLAGLTKIRALYDTVQLPGYAFRWLCSQTLIPWAPPAMANHSKMVN